MQWSPELEDEFLEAVLPSEDDTFYYRAINKFWNDRELRSLPSEGDQYLKRRAIRRTDYEGPATNISRTQRTGKPFTWAELRILEWAKNKNNPESRVEINNRYLARLLARTPEEIEAEYSRQANTRNGIVAFF